MATHSDLRDDRHYDTVIIGAGMGGLTVGSLLAHAGERVAVVEAHEYPGGCCHTFPMGDGPSGYRFCAAVHYIFSCGEGEPVYNLLKKLGLHERVTFERLDPEGYDHFSCPAEGLRFRIPNGLGKWCARMCDRFPGEARAIRAFFHVVTTLAEQLDNLPEDFSLRGVARALLESPQVVQVLRYRGHTLQRLYDEHRLSPRVQAVLSTQLGDVGLPPDQVSLLIWVALVARYGDGAFYPTEHFSTFIDAIANVITSAPGCTIAYNSEVNDVRVEGDRIASVVTKDGREFRGARFICNADPKWFVERVGPARFPTTFLRKVDYQYSSSSFSLYLGVKDLDLRAHGFGNWNVWHYPSLDINGTYRAQHEHDDLSDPWLFMSTPTLCSPQAKTRHAPEGHQILEVITTCAHQPFAERQARGLRDYTERKNAIRDRIIDIVEQRYVPGLRAHLAMKVAGTPTTNRRYLWAPQGNIYGSALTPLNVDAGRLSARSPIDNLFFTGASAAFPSIGGTVSGGARLYTELTGDIVSGARTVRRAS
jgi:all-trans-retinol 13,14-reductase